MLIPMYITFSDGDELSLMPFAASSGFRLPSARTIESQMSRDISPSMSTSPLRNMSHCVLRSSTTRYFTSSKPVPAAALRLLKTISWFLRQ